MTIALYLSMPTIMAVTVVGLLIALVQALIQVQEQTLGFAAKLAAMVVIFALWGRWMLNQMLTFLSAALGRVADL